MTDDLEPRLGDHLRHRASRVQATPDLADVHHRVDARHRRHARALGAALVIALVAGPVAGWAVAQSVEPDRDTLTAAGPGSASDDGSESGGGTGPGFEGTGAGYLDPEMEPQSDRTTAEGIRLVVRSTVLDPQNPPCQMDGLVRVGIVDGQLVDVALTQTAPSHASFGIAGGADGRPMWVVVARGVGRVSATFPNGSVDSVEATGVAVLAAYADEGQSASELVDDVVEVTGLPGRAVEEGPRLVTIADGTTGCAPDPVVAPPVDLSMPEPGEPPEDEEAARAEIEELFSAYGGQDPDTQMAKHERPNVWRDADARFREQYPNYLEWAKETYGVVHEIVFTAPDRASVRRSLVSDNPEIPAPGQRIGEAVLIDGVWKISIETSCSDLGLASIECDYSIEG